MTTTRKITKSRTSPSLNKAEKRILEQLLAELEKETTGENTPSKATKSEALVQLMVTEALKGDQRMLANILKLIDRLGPSEDEVPKDTHESHSRADWELMFAFFGKYEALIKQEIDRLRDTHPSYWTFDWFHPTLESTPWYEAFYGRKG